MVICMTIIVYSYTYIFAYLNICIFINRNLLILILKGLDENSLRYILYILVTQHFSGVDQWEAGSSSWNSRAELSSQFGHRLATSSPETIVEQS